VRREVSPGGFACRFEGARERDGGRALAVGADYLDDRQRAVRIAEELQESLDAVEA
jgi:hypothetical protein